MKYVVRKSCFETNSSSIHAISLSKEFTGSTIPITEDTFYFIAKRLYASEYNTFLSPEDKASYLYTAIVEDDVPYGKLNTHTEADWIHFITETLKPYFKDVKFYIEHTEEEPWDPVLEDSINIYDFLQELYGNKNMLLEFLFDPVSKVQIFDNHYATIDEIKQQMIQNQNDFEKDKVKLMLY